jgi:hypothetical protein
MLTAFILIAVAGLIGIVASRVMWWAAHRSGLWAILLGPLLGLAAIMLVVLFGYLWAWLTGPF